MKTKLSGNNNEILKKIMDNTLKGTLEEGKYTSYEFANGSALLADENGDYLRMHVKATPKNVLFKNNPNDIELRIPTSDINYQPTSVKITIKTKEGSKLQGINGQETFITYDIGVEATPHITPNGVNNVKNKFVEYTTNDGIKSLKVDLSKDDSIVGNTAENKYGSVTPIGLANSLGWTIKTSELFLRQQSFRNINENRNELNLNHKKISEDLKIFNVTFSNLIVESIDNKDPSANDYTGKYKIKITATLNKDYSWDDGTNEPKVITLNSSVNSNQKNDSFLINIADAIIDKTVVFGNDTNNPMFNTEISDVNLTNQTTLNQWIGVKENKEKLENEIKIKLSSVDTERKNIGIKYELSPLPGVVSEWLKVGEQQKKLRCTPVLLPGHILKDSTNESTKLQPFDLIITKTGIKL